MPVFSINEKDQVRIVSKIANFLEEEGIYGQIELSFLNNYDPDAKDDQPKIDDYTQKSYDYEPKPAFFVQKRSCWKLVNGIWQIEYPCST